MGGSRRPWGPFWFGDFLCERISRQDPIPRPTGPWLQAEGDEGTAPTGPWLQVDSGGGLEVDDELGAFAGAVAEGAD
jgi:hypothetical protein